MRYQAIVSTDGPTTVVSFPHCSGCRARVPAGKDFVAPAVAALAEYLEAQLAGGGVPMWPGPVRRRIPAGARLMSVPVPPLLAVRIELRAARRVAGLSQRALALRLGVSQQQVAQFESRSANLTLARLVELAALLDQDVEIALVRPTSSVAVAGPEPTRRNRTSSPRSSASRT